MNQRLFSLLIISLLGSLSAHAALNDVLAYHSFDNAYTSGSKSIDMKNAYNWTLSMKKEAKSFSRKPLIPSYLALSCLTDPRTTAALMP